MAVTSSQQLKQRIKSLEADVARQELDLGKDYANAFEMLKPSNLIRSAIKEVVNSPETIDSIAAMSAGVGAGMAARNIITGDSDSFLRKFIGSMAETGTNNIVSRHYPVIKSCLKELLLPILKNKN